MNRLPLVLLPALVFMGCAEPEKPPASIATMIEDPALLDAVLARCTAGDEEFRARRECKNARRAVDAVATAETEDKEKADLEAQSERKRAALRRQRDRVDQQREVTEERAETKAAAKEAEELTGSADYADHLIAEEAVVLPPTTPIGAVIEPEITEDAPLPGLDESAICTIDPVALSAADLEMLLIALQEEWQFRQARDEPAGANDGEQLPGQETGSATEGDQQENKPAAVFSGGGGG
ncbi:MAG: EexN family lipoprotein [Gammaproteobacteria bacterium]|nr:EexN family lipoprotein [Gammaproteobacteria bacterium]